MCDHHAFNPSARGNMNEPFFQHNHHCGLSHHNRSPSPTSWAAAENWAESAPVHQSATSTPVSPKAMDCLQCPHLTTDAEQHELALALCVDECGECDDPACSEPDCEADIIECTNASCSQPPVQGACHGGNNTVCVGNFPPDVLDGAASLAALRPPSYSQIYPPQPMSQYVPLCVAIAAGYYNPGHIHSHLAQCGPHTFSNDYSDHSYFSGGNNMVQQALENTNSFTFGDSHQDCQYPGMYYDMDAQAVSQMPFDHRLSIKSEFSISSISHGSQQPFSFSHDSTPSSASTFPSPLQTTSETISDQTQAQSISTSSSFPSVPMCRWEIEKGLVCGQTFETIAQLQNHIQQVHTAPLRKAHGFTCQWQNCPRRDKGGDSFAQRSKLDRHIQSHTGYKASICSICGQQFSTTQSLILHQRTHSGEKPHKCPHPGCGYAAAQASQLTMHNRTKHTKEKPLKCDFPGCNARFAESSNLSKHKKIHLPEAQCACPLCFKSFSRDDQLKRHLKTHARKANEGRGRSLSLGAKAQAGLGLTPFPEVELGDEMKG